MRRAALALAGILLLACSAPAPPPAPPAAGTGGIRGRVGAKPHEGVDAEDLGGGGRYSTHALRDARFVDYDRPGPVAVLLIPAGESLPAAATSSPDVEVRARGTGFRPALVVVPAGGRVRFAAEDDAPHRAYSWSDARPFRGRTIAAGETSTIRFPEPGVVRVFDEYDPRPELTVIVARTAWAAVTDDSGEYAIGDVPAGEYLLRTWHARFPPVEMPIRVKDGRWTRIDVTIGVDGLPSAAAGGPVSAASLPELMRSEIDPAFTYLSFAVHHAGEEEIDPERVGATARRLAVAARGIGRFVPPRNGAEHSAFARLGRELADRVTAAAGGIARGNRREAVRALRLARDSCLGCHERYREEK